MFMVLSVKEGTAMSNRLFKGVLLATSAVVVVAFAAPASAQTTADQAARIAALEAQLAEISQALTDLKTSTAATTDDLSKRLNATTIALPSGKPALATVDGAFTANIRGVIQLDAAQYRQEDVRPATVVGRDLNSGTNFRRFRLGVEGKVFRDFDYSLLTDFGGAGVDGPGVIQEAYVQYNGLLVPGVTVGGAPAALRIRAGAFAPNLGLEDAASTSFAIFPERATPAELARSLAGADKRIGLQVGLNSDRWLVSAAVTGAKAGDAATTDEQLGYLGRAVFTPIKEPGFLIHVGVNGSVVAQPAQAAFAGPYNITLSDRPELRVDGTSLISTGAIDARNASHVGGELAVQKNNFLLQGEYYQYKIGRRLPTAGQTDPKFDGWYAEASYIFGVTAPRKYNVVTGAFDAPTIAKTYSLRDGGWGAWEIAARYSDANLNDNVFSTTASNRVRGGDQKIWTGQLNWFLNSSLKLGLSYYDVQVDRLDAAGARAGQDYQAVNFRTAFAF